MKARALISVASYGPETLKVICQAFERLAQSVLADENCRDAEARKTTALQVPVMTYGHKSEVRTPPTQ